MNNAVKVLFASGSSQANTLVLDRLKRIFPELPLVVVSEFAPAEGEWIPYHIHRAPEENLDLVRWCLRGRAIRLGAVILEPRIPQGPLRRMGFTLARLNTMVFNETGNHFMLRPRSIPAMLRYGLWRARNLVRSQFEYGGLIYKARLLACNPRERRLTLLYRRALKRGRWLVENRERNPPLPYGRGSVRDLGRNGQDGAASGHGRPVGISVVIPSRNGAELLRSCLPRITGAQEIIVVENGSTEGTCDYPSVIVVESAEPLSFARAVNLGIARARYSHVCLLNNDMWVEPGFLEALRRPFDTIPDLFASTAQIFFPAGQRREETGKTVMPASPAVEEFPVRCDEPCEGEDQSYVLYGSGGCTLYDAAKLEALGGFDEAYEPAYVEDLDLGVRAWLWGWPSVYTAGARVLHFHRTTTSKYFSEADLDQALDVNFVRFLARAIPDRAMFQRMWNANALRLKVKGSVAALEAAATLAAPTVSVGDSRFFALGFFALVNGDAAVFPGRPRSGKPVVLIASPYVPFPLSHGAAVRIYNLMRRAASDFDQVLIAFSEEAGPIPQELRDICVEIVRVRRPGSHALPSTPRPDTVEEFDSPTFHAALRETMAKWQPGIAQFEFTQMVQYAADCPGARTILVEHDITYDLYSQMLARADDWETRRQYQRWVRFERIAWTQVDRVVTMSDKDRALVNGAVTIANGVDLERFRPSTRPPEPRRLLFIGSFAHKPNVLALEFFLSDVFPKLSGATLHVIAGQRHERFWDLKHAGVEIEGFVSDVRPAYERAAVVIAPLVASAGTNIKIIEAMAMGKAIVSTEAGIHGLELERGRDAIVTDSADELAAQILRLLDAPSERAALERQARTTAERLYGWDAIGLKQKQLYESLLSTAR